MSKNNIVDDYSDDFDWEEEFEGREAEKNKNKARDTSRRLNVKRRMDDYLESKRAKSQSRYLNSFDDLSFD